MKPQRFVLALLMLGLFGLCSCRTSCPNTATIPVNCVVQMESSAIYEVALDGKVVGSGRVPQNSQQCVTFEATRGEHVLHVTATGMEPYQKTIEVTGAGKNLQSFFVELKQSGH